MKVSGGLNSAGISNLYNTLYQGKIAMHNNKLSREFFPVNNVKGEGAFSTNALQYINDIKSGASELSGALKELTNSAFSQNTMVSSNKDVMSVNYSGNNLGSMNDMSVKVDQIATGQLNEGSSMSSSALYSGDRGVNRFEINTGGKTTQLSISVAAGDSNKDVQQKMATAINNAGLGLKATVETDSKTNVSMLRVESTNVGTAENNAFSLRDVTGNAVAQTGANDMSRDRQDAIYSVNGGPAQTSRSNTINLGNGLTATLRAASEEEVNITRGSDLGQAISAVESMVRGFNKMFGAAAANLTDPKAQGLASRSMNISAAYSRSLSDIGISFDAGGRMLINSQKLSQAAENGKLEQFFTENRGKNFGFAAMMGRLSDNVSTNTSNFVSSSVFGSSMGENFSYSGLGNSLQFNFLNSGSILDYMF